MSKPSLEASFDTLKQTIPLLLKHSIPAIPTNYALWYTYVNNDSPELNAELDNAVADNQPLSELKSQELYRTHLADKQEVSIWDLRQSLEGMLIELNQSMKDTRSDTSEYKTVMDRCIDDLNKVEQEGWTIEEVMGLVRNMVTEAQTIRQSTISFNSALSSAEKEIERLREQLKESQQEALYDALTGLCNRRYFDSEIESKIAMDRISLMLIDIDHFKVINDTHGHQMGDLVLKAVARKLQSGCRDNAQVFRYGGEEFALIMPNADLPIARRVAESLRKSVEKIAVKNRRTGETLGDITVSIGVAQKEENEAHPELIERADKLLYQAKKLGRNRVMPIT
ncbi:GGDEF domain-containing protein [Aestuariibacter sp. AA17]|uniref:diguanylate cyclase n=1 Tax=Fluctibacter corallii TaxID=2984329 RepID=A0ABT3A783_9ALTE|nr:GGDEF domain-containing protein [Aestuariibacter sp. AA17]MCV2884553.1 GGDEF domain-containing protein [Aestuariibacter sp. AA17]